MKILVTGAAGFIGSYVSKRLTERGDHVIGIDNINDYYDVNFKYARLSSLGISKQSIEWGKTIGSNKYNNFSFIQIDIADRQSVQRLFEEEKFDKICHLAAQAGVRYSLENPHAYIKSNIDGFLNILEGCRFNHIKHLVYASSSSVYGLNGKVPFSEKDGIAHPVSLYAATKKSNELMAHTYSYLYGIPTTGLRFFTVYGPWGRPDMSPFIFANAILKDKPIQIFNQGDMLRDFTYIDDIVEGVLKVIDHVAMTNEQWNNENADPSTSLATYKIYNIGNSTPVKLMDFIYAIEKELGKEATKIFLPMQPGDVYQTNADTQLIQDDIGFKPITTLEKGIAETIKWYKSYYKD